jgi:hypothetical protein
MWRAGAAKNDGRPEESRRPRIIFSIALRSLFPRTFFLAL